MKRYATSLELCSSASRLRIAACTETSSADVGSSQTTTRGSPANARAIATRCLRPPESSAGRAWMSRVSKRTEWASSMRRSSRSRPCLPSSFVIARPMMRWMEKRRLSAASGFWKTICSARTSSASRFAIFPATGWPSSSTVEPSSGSVRPSRRRASVVLPLPDSPTSPSVSPGLQRQGDVLHRVDLVAVLLERLAQVLRAHHGLGLGVDHRRDRDGGGRARQLVRLLPEVAAAVAPAARVVERRLLLPADVLRHARSGRRTRRRAGRCRGRAGSPGSCRAARGPCARRRAGCTAAGRRCTGGGGR